MMLSQKLVVALSALALVAAQNFTINPGEVSATLRASWCTAEINSCGKLCAGTTDSNSCEPSDLSYTCTCSNGSAPGLQYYSQTMPTFICQRAFQDCNEANVGNSTGQAACTKNIQDHCGGLDPDNVTDSASTTTSSSSSSASPTTLATTSVSATTTSATAAATTSHNAAAKYLGNSAAVVAAGLFAAFL